MAGKFIIIRLGLIRILIFNILKGGEILIEREIFWNLKVPMLKVTRHPVFRFFYLRTCFFLFFLNIQIFDFFFQF